MFSSNDKSLPHRANRLHFTIESHSSSQDDLASSPAAISQVDELSSCLSEESSDQSDTHSASRSNKYNGPQSTWRSWTASERELAESLNQITAQDLAVHLYNAHALKKRAKNLELHKKSRMAGYGDNSDDTTEGQEWIPPKAWTAWPLPADLVPRETDSPRWASQEFYQPNHSENKNQHQHQDLRDLLVAQVIKKAKERNRGLRQMDGQQQPSETEPEAQSIEQSDDSSISNQSESQDELEPIIMVDDDVANNLLQPMVHHILTKLDGLLEGLHNARKGYMTIDSYGLFIGRSNKKRSMPRPESRRSKSENSVQSFSSGCETSFTSDFQSPAKVYRVHQTSNSGIQKRKKEILQRRRIMFGLRDWSDVVGVASMTGWDPAIIQNASFRCSTLFNEGIKFRKLEENGNGSNEISVLPNTSNSDSWTAGHEIPHHDGLSSCAPAPVREADSQDSQDEELRWLIRCPVSTCNRSRRGFRYPYALRRHLKQVHQGEPAFEELGAKASKEEMFGGVHVDGFLQPITRAGSWIPRKRPLRPKSKSNQSGN